MKKIATFILAVLLLISVSACTGNSYGGYAENFYKYHGMKMYDKINLKSEQRAVISSIYKEDAYSSRVVLDFSIVGDEYAWIKMTPDEQKADMQDLAEKFFDYANNSKWNNDYYLYIKTDIGIDSHYVYDAETQKLHVPKKINLVIEIYEKFKTFYLIDVEKTENGKQFLIDNNLGSIKHGKFERNSIGLLSYSVSVYEGEFKEYFKGHSNEF